MRAHSPELVETPVMRGTVLHVCHLDGHHGLGHGAVVVTLGADELGPQRRVERVGEQHELELDALAQLHADGVRLLQEDRVAPQVVLCKKVWWW